MNWDESLICMITLSNVVALVGRMALVPVALAEVRRGLLIVRPQFELGDSLSI